MTLLIFGLTIAGTIGIALLDYRFFCQKPPFSWPVLWYVLVFAHLGLFVSLVPENSRLVVSVVLVTVALKISHHFLRQRVDISDGILRTKNINYASDRNIRLRTPLLFVKLQDLVGISLRDANESGIKSFPGENEYFLNLLFDLGEEKKEVRLPFLMEFPVIRYLSMSNPNLRVQDLAVLRTRYIFYVVFVLGWSSAVLYFTLTNLLV